MASPTTINTVVAGVGSANVTLSVSNGPPSVQLPTFAPSVQTPTLAPSVQTPTLAPTRNREFHLSLSTPEPSTAPSNFPTQAPTAWDQHLKKSPELMAIGLTMAWGSGVLVLVIFAFAVAMRCRNTNIAPRCEARPRNVIYNPDRCCDPAQKKGNPFCLGWVFWVLSLKYKELLGGVPGTGTREGGMEGRMLSVNLDHIILLRFNSLGLRISIVAMLIYITACFPIYYYSRCPWVPLGDVNFDYDENVSTLNNTYMYDIYMNCTNEQNYTFSSYSRFTLGNVPNLGTEILSWSYALSNFTLCMVSIASWLVCWYCLFELQHEWIDEVALRRVYYLEYNHWKGAKDDMEATMLNSVRDSDNRYGTAEVQEKHLFERPVWIPHPEQRDTPSNIELYSVLVGGIPMRPDEAMDQEDVEAALANENSQVDWQMSVVSAFFDSCIPNQPGFSSSIAAVTILPSAPELAVAWKYWGKASKKLSRLRFIRRRIIELGGQPVGQRLVVKELENAAQSARSLRAVRSHIKQDTNVETKESLRRKEYSAEVLGAGTADDVNDEFWKNLDLGPEQIAVYSMEFSKGLAGCCPHGFCEQRISYCTDLDDLYEMEAEAADAVTIAYEQLKAAGAVAATAHEKRKDMIKLTDITTDFLESPQLSMNVQSTTTEMQLLKKRRDALEKGFSGIGESKVIVKDSANQKGVSFSGLDNGDSDESRKADASSTNPGASFERGLMRRASAARLNSIGNSATNENDLWKQVQDIASESKNLRRRRPTFYAVQNGKWGAPTLGRLYRGFRKKLTSCLMWTGDESNEAADLMARDSTYAVVTFTSRQSAIAARQCLADGRGAESFTTQKIHPVPPLADSSAFNICDCRGFTKPVTIGLNQTQKQWRKLLMMVGVVFIYIFYAAPIALLAEYGTQLVLRIFPGLEAHEATIDGFVQAQLLSLILAFLPDVFLFLANFGSNATSLVESENAALHYYWHFMVIYAVIGQGIARMFTTAYQTQSVDISTIINEVSRTIPVDLSYTWTNWIINRAMVLTPTFYLLQANAFLFGCIGARCCVRMLRGGGSGNRLPYRIYVENGTVLLCTLVFAPVAPIISPFAVLYFFICSPLLRYVLIFTYKPPFDSGGSRWPALFDSIITSMCVAQVILAAVLILKQAIPPAVLAFVPIIPILMFRARMRDRFLRAFMDAALLQTSMLDGWDVGPESEHLSWRDREEYRRFIVDAHKASFVPVCIAATQGGSNSQMTAEPAVVVPLTDKEKGEMESEGDDASRDKRAAFKAMHRDKTQQFGALNRRHLGLDESAKSDEGEEPTITHPPTSSPDTATAFRGPLIMIESHSSEDESETSRNENDSPAEDKTPTASDYEPSLPTVQSKDEETKEEKNEIETNHISPPIVEELEDQASETEEEGIEVVSPADMQAAIGTANQVPADKEGESNGVEGFQSAQPPSKVTRLISTFFNLETGEVQCDDDPEKAKKE